MRSILVPLVYNANVYSSYLLWRVVCVFIIEVVLDADVMPGRHHPVILIEDQPVRVPTRRRPLLRSDSQASIHALSLAAILPKEW